MKLADFSLLPFIASIGILFNASRSEAVPTNPDAEGFIGPTLTETELEEPTPVKFETIVVRDNGTVENVVDLGGRIKAITNRTNSWDTLYRTAKKHGDALIDIHFNKYRCEDSGPLLISSKEALPLAENILAEFVAIYEENGWEYQDFKIITKGSYGIINRGNWNKYPTLITEFGFCDDPSNPISEKIQTPELQARIARAYQDAIEKTPEFGIVVVSAGHHCDEGSRGTFGATTECGYHETDFAFDCMTAMANMEWEGGYISSYTDPTDDIPIPDFEPNPLPDFIEIPDGEDNGDTVIIDVSQIKDLRDVTNPNVYPDQGAWEEVRFRPKPRKYSSSSATRNTSGSSGSVSRTSSSKKKSGSLLSRLTSSKKKKTSSGRSSRSSGSRSSSSRSSRACPT